MRRITDCFNSTVNTLVKRATEIDKLDNIVQQYFPEAAHIPCKVGSFNQGCLVLLVSDPGWASQLRFSLPILRDSLLQYSGLHQLSSIKITLQIDGMSLEAPATPQPPPSKLSSRAREHIMNGADCAYQPLKDALERLGRKQ